MTKAELVDVMYEKLKENEKKDFATPREDYELKKQNYEECKELCKQNGHTDETFSMLWEKAVDKWGREHGVFPETPLYRKA